MTSLFHRARPLLLVLWLAAGCGTSPPGHDPLCGDGLAEGHEACDGEDLRDQTCESLGLRSGSLGCTPDCALDTEACLPPTVCGDEMAEGEESCDGSDLRDQTCLSLGYYGGTLFCGPDCGYDLVLCEAAGWCGDGILNVPPGFPEEVCDDGNAVDWDGCTACQASEIRVSKDPVDPEYPENDRLATVTIDPWGDVTAMWWVDYWHVDEYGDRTARLAKAKSRRVSAQGIVSESVNFGGYYIFDEPQTVLLASDEEGNVLAVWWLCLYWGEGILARWFNPDMTRLTDEFDVAWDTAPCGYNNVYPVLAGVTGPTESVVLWGVPGGAILGSRFLLGQPVESLVIPAPESGPRWDGYPIHMDQPQQPMAWSNAGFLLVWSTEHPDAERQSQVFLRRYSPEGEVIEPDLTVSDQRGEGASDPRVAAWPDGRFLVTYNRLDYATDISSWDRDVYARLYESDGTPATGELRLNDIVSGNQALGRGSTSVLCDSGDFVTFWHGPRPGTEQHRLYGRHFHADSTPKGPEKVIGSDVGWEAGLWLSAQVAGDGACERFAAVGRIPPHHILVARMNASLDLIGADPW